MGERSKSEIARRYGGAEMDWRAGPCGSWIHADARISSGARLLGPAVFRGGEFLGGDFWGGIFRGGRFWGGTFWGGRFWGGRFWGGVFRGGIFRGGEFFGGLFRGGEFTRTPLQLFGIVPWPVTVSNPDTKEVTVGCHSHPLSWWKSHWRELPKSDRISATRVEILLRLVEDDHD